MQGVYGCNLGIKDSCWYFAFESSLVGIARDIWRSLRFAAAAAAYVPPLCLGTAFVLYFFSRQTTCLVCVLDLAAKELRHIGV